MKITKFGHCCLLIEERDLRILTDPGNYTTAQNELTDIDIVLITHEHGDHYHAPSVKAIMKNNPEAKIVTNASVAKLLEKEGFTASIVGDGEQIQIGELLITGHGTKHAEIFKDFGQVENTAYFIGPRLFYPGDSYYNPNKPVEVLALPMGGPWVKIGEAIQYAIDLSPKFAFSVHDGGLKSTAFVVTVANNILPDYEIKLVDLELGKATEF